MIKSQGLLLKFEKIYSQLSNTDATPCTSSEVESDVGSSIDTEKIKLSKPCSEHIVKEQSKIYGRNKNAKLSKWQEAVNDAAFSIVKQSPDKMYDRSLLKTIAEKEARKTYIFKKKSGSRSNYADQNVQKREKLSADDRDEAMKLCSINLQSLTEQCENKQKEITKSSNLKEYEKCAEQHKELRLLLSEKMKSEQKLHKLQKKMKRHLQYVASRATTEVKKGPATTTTCKQDIMSFFKQQKSDSNCATSSTCSSTCSTGGNSSEDTVILSSDENEENVVKKRKIDYYKMYFGEDKVERSEVLGEKKEINVSTDVNEVTKVTLDEEVSLIGNVAEELVGQDVSRKENATEKDVFLTEIGVHEDVSLMASVIGEVVEKNEKIGNFSVSKSSKEAQINNYTEFDDKEKGNINEVISPVMNDPEDNVHFL